MALRRSGSPLARLSDLREEMNDLWSRFPMLGRLEEGGIRETPWVPRVDIYEEEDKIVVECELPGLKKDDIDVSVDGRQLTISGERREENTVEDEERQVYRSERVYGTFDRTFTLPGGIDAEHVKARFDNGVLKVTVPKTEQAKTKHVSIS